MESIESDSDALESSVDSLKGIKPPPTIQIGQLEDRFIANSKPLFKRQRSIKKRDESEPFDAFLKNCKSK